MRRLIFTCFLLLSLPALAAVTAKPQAVVHGRLVVTSVGQNTYCALVFAHTPPESGQYQVQYVLPELATLLHNDGSCSEAQLSEAIVSEVSVDEASMSEAAVSESWQLVSAQRIQTSVPLTDLQAILVLTTDSDVFRAATRWSVPSTLVPRKLSRTQKDDAPSRPGIHTIRIGTSPR